MHIAALQFLVSFVYVFMKGFQHQNVIGGNYKPAFILCYCMAALEVATVSLIVQQGWSSAIVIGAGASIGIVSSMYLYRKWNHGKTNGS